MEINEKFILVLSILTFGTIPGNKFIMFFFMLKLVKLKKVGKDMGIF